MVSGAIEQFCLHEIVANTQFHKLYSVENRLHLFHPNLDLILKLDLSLVTRDTLSIIYLTRDAKEIASS